MSERDYSWLRLGVSPLEFGLPVDLGGSVIVYAAGYTDHDEIVLFQTKAIRPMVDDVLFLRGYIEEELEREAAGMRPSRHLDPTTIRASRWDGTLAPPTEILMPPAEPESGN